MNFDFRKFWFLLGLFIAGFPVEGTLRAEEIAKAPVVLGFELFHRNKTSGNADGAGGRLLLRELRCTACHTNTDTAEEQRSETGSGPDLSEVGSRLSAEVMRRWLLSPSSIKPGTTMPAVLAQDAGGEKTADDITAYLGSLKGANLPQGSGDLERGRVLYHRIGCVACHEAEQGVAPSGGHLEGEIPKIKTRSIPIKIGQFYPAEVLADFLQKPLHYRPAGRMPSLSLTPEEAMDLAVYLKRGMSAEKISTVRGGVANEAQVARGREAFVRQRCVACHATGEALVVKPARVPALSELRAGKGCLSEKPAAGLPRFGFDPEQKKALELVLSGGGGRNSSAESSLNARLEGLNCLACHTRNGMGGPEAGRAVYFTANDAGAESLGELANLPPKLDHTGHKLTRRWLERLLWDGGGSVRPYMNTRMPQFGEGPVHGLIELFEETAKNVAKVEMDVSGLKGHQRGPIGRQLIGMKGLGCVSCHGMLDRKSLGPPVIRLTQTVERLRPEYFKQLLLDPQKMQPGTLMPPLFMGRPKANLEIESLWTYLKEAETLALPEGLLSEGDYELKPEVEGKAVIFRSFIEGSGSRAIGVGYPQGLHAAYDAAKCRWSLVWKGRFLDAMNNWNERLMPPIKPLGTDVLELPQAIRDAKEGERRFLGYRLDQAGVPTMLVDVEGVVVEDRLEPAADGKGLVRTVRLAGQGLVGAKEKEGRKTGGRTGGEEGGKAGGLPVMPSILGEKAVSKLSEVREVLSW